MIQWRKSSRSTQGTDPNCVEVAELPGGIGVRDSKHPEAGNLLFESTQFAALVFRVKSGLLDR